MDNAGRMRRRESVRDLAQYANRLGRGELAIVPQAIAERLALHVWHRVERQAQTALEFDESRIVQRENVRMLEIRDGPDLSLEPLAVGDASELGVADLECD